MYRLGGHRGELDFVVVDFGEVASWSGSPGQLGFQTDNCSKTFSKRMSKLSRRCLPTTSSSYNSSTSTTYTRINSRSLPRDNPNSELYPLTEHSEVLLVFVSSCSCCLQCATPVSQCVACVVVG